MSATSRNICWRRCITPRSRWTAITHPLSAMTCTAAEKPEKGNPLRTAEMTLEDAKRECAEHKSPEGKKPGHDMPEHDCL